MLRVLAEPNVTLGWNHVPVHCRRARTVLLGPLMPEDIDCQSFVHKTRGETYSLSQAGKQCHSDLSQCPIGKVPSVCEDFYVLLQESKYTARLAEEGLHVCLH